jgi:DNA replication protein DnaC
MGFLQKEEVCPICGGNGTYFDHWDSEGRPIAKVCECNKAVIAQLRIKMSGVPKELRDKTFKNYDYKDKPELKKALNTAVQYCRDFEKIRNTKNNSIAFLGQSGCGKTYLAAAIFNNLSDNGNIDIAYFKYREQMTRFKQIALDKERYSATINQYKNADLLIIDDLMKGKITDADRNPLFEIVDHRYTKRLPIVFSSEKDFSELLDYDEAVMSRLYEMSRGRQVVIHGREYNYRLR